MASLRSFWNEHLLPLRASRGEGGLALSSVAAAVSAPSSNSSHSVEEPISCHQTPQLDFARGHAIMTSLLTSKRIKCRWCTLGHGSITLYLEGGIVKLTRTIMFSHTRDIILAAKQAVSTGQADEGLRHLRYLSLDDFGEVFL